MPDSIEIRVQFYSYFKELTGCAETRQSVPPQTSLGALHQALMERFPRLQPMAQSTLLAVGVEYQPRDYLLRHGDLVALFPPVQGG